MLTNNAFICMQLGSSAILGILEDAHLNANQYNWLSSIFYFGYMVAEWPQNWALQRFPVGKWLAGNLIIWCVIPNWLYSILIAVDVDFYG